MIDIRLTLCHRSPRGSSSSLITRRYYGLQGKGQLGTVELLLCSDRGRRAGRLMGDAKCSPIGLHGWDKGKEELVKSLMNL